MSGMGPPTHVIVGMILGALLLVAALTFGVVWLLARWLPPRAMLAVASAGLLAGLWFFFVGSRSHAGGMSAWGEEAAFWLVSVALGLFAFALWRRRRAPA